MAMVLGAVGVGTKTLLCKTIEIVLPGLNRKKLKKKVMRGCDGK